MSKAKNGGELALASLQKLHSDAARRAELIGEVVRARANLEDQEEMFATLLAKRRREVDRAESAARAAGLDLTTEIPAE